MAFGKVRENEFGKEMKEGKKGDSYNGGSAGEGDCDLTGVSISWAVIAAIEPQGN